MLVIIYLAIFQWFEYPLSSQFPIQKYMTYITHKDIKYKLKLKIILVYLLYFQITSNYLVSGLLICSSGCWIMRCELCLTVYLNSYIFFDFYLFFFDLILFFILFYFIFWTMKRYITMVIWYITWHYIISLEHYEKN